MRVTAAWPAVTLVVVVAGGGGDARAEGDAPALRAAVLPLRAEGLQLNEAQRLNALVRVRAEMRGGLVVQTEETTHSLVDSAQALGIDCDVVETKCAARLGRIADVGLVLVAHAVALGDEVGLDLVLVDVASERERRRVVGLVAAEPEAQLAGVNALFTKLFEPDEPLAALYVEAQPAGASILVDGLPRGTTPLATPILGLVPGAHVVTVKKEGYLEASARLALDAGAPTRHTLKLLIDPAVREPPPGLVELTAPWLLAGLGVVVAAGGAVTTGLGAVPWLSYQARAQALDNLATTSTDYNGEAMRIRDELVDDAAAWNGLGRYLVGAGGGLLALGIAGAAGGAAWGFSVAARALAADDVE